VPTACWGVTILLLLALQVDLYPTLRPIEDGGVETPTDLRALDRQLLASVLNTASGAEWTFGLLVLSR
jgi:hypothetical protein